jgi:hypothetical protein
MDTFSSLTHAPPPQPALDSLSMLRELEGFLPQWPSDLAAVVLADCQVFNGYSGVARRGAASRWWSPASQQAG